MGGDHQTPRHVVGDADPVIGTHDVQTQIQTGGAAGAGQHPPVIDVERRPVDRDVRIARLQGVGIDPVRGGRATVEDARGCQRERARADRHQPGLPPIRRPDRLDERRRDRLVDIAHARDHHRVRIGQRFQPVGRAHRCAAEQSHLGRLGAQPHRVPRTGDACGEQRGQLRHAEDLGGQSRFETGHAVIGEDRDRMHGTILTNSGLRATVAEHVGRAASGHVLQTTPSEDIRQQSLSRAA